MSSITDANVAARLEVARAAARSPRWPVYVPVNAAAAAWTAIVPAAARPWRLVEPDLIDLPDTAWAGKEGERHRTADQQQLGRQDDRHAGGQAGRTGVARSGAAKTRNGEAAIGAALKVDWPPRAVAARAVNVQLKAVAADVAYRLEWKRKEHGADRNAAASQESLCQQ